ncbi:MAG: Stp1/IreP family PP2C-type Ser/Thr phosphatase [bacterium]|nr:Stp1/IreP family PP2C-type Ser/Thr phosphatase [bacterium]
MSVQFHYAARSDVGLVRSNNQDSGYAGPHLLVLADGMGGPAGGDIASSVAVAHLAPLDGDVPPADNLLPLLRDAIESAHDELMDRSQQDSDLAGLGTTAIAILRSGNKLGMVHIGDSRAYLLRAERLTQVTQDHTYVQHLVDTGRITAEEAEVHPNRNMILRALGDTAGEVTLDESVREARPGDRWLLCSDGLSGMVAAETIEKTMNREKDPAECADKLVDLALRSGGTDNVTVIVCDVVATGSVPSDSSLSTVPQIVGAAANKSWALSRASTPGGGGSSAAKAAALTPRTEADPEEETPLPRRRRRLGAVIGLLLILGLLAGGMFAGYRWTQTQYFVADDDGWVSLYRGIPQTLGPITFAELHERTDIEVSRLTGLAKNRLQSPITRGSLEEAEQVVENLRSELVAPERGYSTSRKSGGPNSELLEPAAGTEEATDLPTALPTELPTNGGEGTGEGGGASSEIPGDGPTVFVPDPPVPIPTVSPSPEVM